MSQYNVIAESNESTVVSEYKPNDKRSDAYQSEAELEKEFISLLQEQSYEYVSIKAEEDLIKNLRKKIEELNDYNKTAETKPMTMYEEYLSVQNKNPDCYILKRVGDFYEIMGEKAKEVAENIDITLTGRNVGLPERVPMVGFPYHVFEQYVEKLLHFASVE